MKHLSIDSCASAARQWFRRAASIALGALWLASGAAFAQTVDLSIGPLTVGTIVANANGSWTIPVTFTVTNNGTGTASPPWYDLGYLSSNGVLDSADASSGSLNYRSTSLAAGASYTVNASYTTTTTTMPGSYTFFVKADGHSPSYTGGTNTDNGGLVETNETNNTASAAVTLSRPDLSIGALTVGTIVANANGSWAIPVTFTVTNNGTVAAQSPWYDLGYLSSDAILDNADASNGSLNYRSTPLAAGASYTVNATYTTATTTTPGSYTLFVKTDGHNPTYTGGTNTDTGGLVETNEANNTTSATVTLVRPDLGIGAVTVGTIVANANGSWTIPVTFTVTNSGTVAAQPAWYDLGYLSADAVLDNADPSSTGTLNYRSTALAAGASYTVNANYTTSTTTTPGNYTLFVKADGHSPAITGGTNTDTGGLAETNEANNTTSAAVTLSRPNLGIGSLTTGAIVANANGSWTIPVSFTVTNSGTFAAQPAWYDLGYLSTDAVLDNSDAPATGVLNYRSTALAAGASYTVNTNFTTATTTTPGTYTLIVKADGHSPTITGGTNTDNGGLTETNEANNTVSTSVTLTRPDLTISGLTIGSIVANANSWIIPVTFTVTNSGTVAAQPAWYDLGYLSSNATLDNADQSNGMLNYRSAALAAGASYTVTANYTTTTTTAPGAYTFFVKADGHSPGTTGGTNTDNGALAETNETNNLVSAAVTLVSISNTSTALASSVNPLNLGQSTTLTATVTGSSPTGNVIFKDGTTTLGVVPLSGGAASYLAWFTATGTHALSASYVGDGANNPSTSPTVNQVVNINATTMALTSSVNPVIVGQLTALSTTVTPSGATGTVTFKDGATTIGTGTIVGGVVSLSASFTTTGAHSLTAQYSGDATYSGSVSPSVNQSVNAAAGGPGSPMTWAFGYDPEGNLKSSLDPNNNSTTATYDKLQRATQVVQPPAVPAGPTPTINITYDGQDNVKTVQDPRTLTTTYTLDGLANPTTQASPDTGTTLATYDAAGNILTQRDARLKTTTYTYDILNRVKTISYQTGVGTVFEYDGGTAPYPGSIGKLTKMTDESGVTTFTYDALGRLISRSALVGGKTIAAAYTWGTTGTAIGKITSITYPSKARVNYSYDAAGRVQALTVNPPNSNGVGTNTGVYLNILSAITYNADNNILGWTWANNAPYARTYDTFGRLSSFPVGYPLGSGIAAGLTRTLVYDNAGRITGYNHSNIGGAQAAFNQGFGYDGLDRLVQQTTTALTYGYGYDLNGNRTTLTQGANTYTNTVGATSNRLTVVQTAGTGGLPVNNNQTYTASGSLTADGFATFAYSDRGRMSNSTKSGSTTTYKYNGLEQRVSKTGTLVPTGAAYYAYDEDGKTIGEYDVNLYPVAETVYIGTTPVAVFKETGTAAASTIQLVVGNAYADQIDTPRVVTRNSDEAILWRWDGTEAFGNSAPVENPSGLGAYKYNQRMPGQIFDAEDQNFYNWNRDYQPKTARYAQSDPVGLTSGVNTYAYTDNDPLTSMDPSGLLSIHHHFGITYLAARLCGMTIAESTKLAWNTMMVDKGTQSDFAYDTNIHAMRGWTVEKIGSVTIKGVVRPILVRGHLQSVQQASIAINKILQTAPLPIRMHTAQDKAAPLHDGHVWDGELSWENALHIYRDVMPQFSTIRQAYRNSREALGCSCRD